MYLRSNFPLLCILNLFVYGYESVTTNSTSESLILALIDCIDRLEVTVRQQSELIDKEQTHRQNLEKELQTATSTWMTKWEDFVETTGEFNLYLLTLCSSKGLHIQLFLLNGLDRFVAIFQLNSDGTVVQFPNLDLLPGT